MVLTGSDGSDDAVYPLWTNFKRFILEPALEELEKVEFPVTYTENKRGKKVDSLTFHMPRAVEAQTGKTKLSSEEQQAYPNYWQ